jgi:predicted MFS family arabinose efflux permease
MPLLTRSAAPITDRGGRRAHRRLIGVLAGTQTVGYGVLTYAFSVLLPAIATDLHTSRTAVTAAYTTSVLTAALAAIPVGRILDRYGGRALMTAGSALGAVAVLAWSQISTVGQLYAVFVLIGLASAMSLYEAAFPVLVATVDPAQRTSAILTVTIVAGFASSIFFPLTGWLLADHGWRHTLIALAVLLAIATIPAHAFTVSATQRGHAPSTTTHRRAAVHSALRERRFWLLAAAFIAHSAAVSMFSVHLVTYLGFRGHPAGSAATLAGLLGILSVAGRLTTSGLARRWPLPAVTAAVFALQVIGVAVLAAVGRFTGGAAIAVILFGLGFGVATIARPAILADRYGTSGYATIAATMAMPVTLAKAGAPLAAAALPLALLPWVIGCCCALAGAALALTARRTQPDLMPT